jgi:hypothetical protein
MEARRSMVRAMVLVSGLVTVLDLVLAPVHVLGLPCSCSFAIPVVLVFVLVLV